MLLDKEQNISPARKVSSRKMTNEKAKILDFIEKNERQDFVD